MPYIDPSVIEQVKRIDLLTYLENRNPGELVRLGNNTYCTKTHDSLKLSNGRWYWWSQGFGGKTALDYLVKVRGMTFLDAVGELSGSNSSHLPAVPIKPKPVADKSKFVLPMRAKNNDNAVSYLRLRGIDPLVINHCIKSMLILESKSYHKPNVVFVGRDSKGIARYAAIRGCFGDFKGEANCSDKRFAFRLNSSTPTPCVHVFESAIDVLSYATLILEADKDFREFNLLSLGGIPPRSNSAENTRIPQALTQFLSDNPQTKQVCLHLDNDEPGIHAASMIASALTLRNFDVSISPPPEGKDVNDYLMLKRPKPKQPEALPLRESRLRPVKKSTVPKREMVR
jgi:hypothetical protein